MKALKFLSLVALMAGISACTQKTDSLEKSYKMAVAAGDYRAAGNALVLWLNQDSSIQNWAYDSLAYIHYFHLGGSGEQVRNPKTPLYYAEAGLKQNAKSTFLREIKAKLLLEQGKDTASMVMLRNLYDETKDQTYWWDMCFVEMARGNVMGCDSMVTLALADPKVSDKKVRMEHIAAGVAETVNAKAAFIYLQALMLRGAGDVMASANALEAALKEDKDFYAAKQSILDLQRMYAQQQRGGR
ncbi:MAG: hypothetical protein RLZZ504_1894 [Bacteroidota bacterium]|jgi:hypothetical protein